MADKIMLIIIFMVVATSAQVLTVYDVQYTTDPSGDSPYKDSVVTVEGVVVANHFDGDKYFIADTSGGTFSGLYVYDYAHTVSQGDLIQVTGTVQEFHNLTELSYITDFRLISSGVALPAPAVLSAGDIAQEAYENVLVEVRNVVVATTLDSAGRFYVVGDGDTIIAADGFGFSYSASIGDTIDTLRGMVYYTYGEYRLEPRGDGDIIIAGTAPDTSDTISGDVLPICYVREHASEGDTVTVEGVVFVGAGVLDTAYLKAYIQDSSGCGVQLFDYQIDASASSILTRGNRVRARGIVDIYNNVFEIKTPTLELIESGVEMPTPRALTASELSLDDEGSYIELRGVISENYTTDNNNFNAEISDSTGTAVMRIWGSTGIPPDSLALGEEYTVRGVGSIYISTDTTYQLLPAYLADIIHHTSADTMIQPPTGDDFALDVPRKPFIPSIGEMLPITVNIASPSRVVLALYDIRGRLRRTLIDGNYSDGATALYDGTDDYRKPLAPGTYILYARMSEDDGGTVHTDKAPVVIAPAGGAK